jgi:hypothetical protein
MTDALLSAAHRRQPLPERADPSPYRNARNVEMRAAQGRFGEDEATRTAIDRLSGLLRSGQPLRSDVLPGYYLNIRI